MMDQLNGKKYIFFHFLNLVQNFVGNQFVSIPPLLPIFASRRPANRPKTNRG